MATTLDLNPLPPLSLPDQEISNQTGLSDDPFVPTRRRFDSPRKLFSSLKQHGLPGILLLVLLISLPLAIFATYQEVRNRSRGMENPITPPVTPPNTPPITPMQEDVDAQTGEYYDLWFDVHVKLLDREGAGPTHMAQVNLSLGGPRLQSYQNLTAIKQQSETPYADNTITFSLQNPQNVWDRFGGSFITVGSQNNCLDLYTNNTEYVATLCYSDTVVSPGTNTTIYTSAANPFVQFDYAGSQPSLVFSMSTAFNKHNKPGSYQNGPLMTRVNFFTIDSDTSSLSDYNNVNYIIQGLTSGLNDTQYATLCTNATNPQKYLKFSLGGSNPKPEGGNSDEVDVSEGACGYRKQYNSFRPFFVSLYVDGGVPIPYPTTLPTPTLDPEPSDSPTPTPGEITPTAFPTQTPTPTVVPSPTPTPPPINLSPQLITVRLKNATIGTQYSTTIRGLDLDSNNISIKASGLPRGMRVNRCSSKQVLFGSTVTCSVSGTPGSASRNYAIVFTLTDREGGVTQKTLTLKVRPAR